MQYFMYKNCIRPPQLIIIFAKKMARIINVSWWETGSAYSLLLRPQAYPRNKLSLLSSLRVCLVTSQWLRNFRINYVFKMRHLQLQICWAMIDLIQVNTWWWARNVLVFLLMLFAVLSPIQHCGAIHFSSATSDEASGSYTENAIKRNPRSTFHGTHLTIDSIWTPQWSNDSRKHRQQVSPNPTQIEATCTAIG